MLLTKSLTCMFFFKCFFFPMLCSRYVYMQTHVLFMSKNKDIKG